MDVGRYMIRFMLLHQLFLGKDIGQRSIGIND